MPARAKAPAKPRTAKAKKAAAAGGAAKKRASTAAKPKPKAARKPAAKPKAARKPAAAAPKKPRGAQAAKPHHPSYADMTLEALGAHRGGTILSRMSWVRVQDFILGNWSVTGHVGIYVRKALAELASAGLAELFRTGGHQFVLTKEGRDALRNKDKKKKARVSKKKPAARQQKGRKPAPKAAAKGRKAAPKKAVVRGAGGRNAGHAAALAKAAAASSQKHGKHGKSISRGSGSTTFSVAVPGSAYGFFWQYKDDSRGGWCNYDVKASDVCEKVYLAYLENRGDTDVRAVKSGQWEYMVDFAAMKQTNLQHQAHTVRDIRRVKNSASKK